MTHKIVLPPFSFFLQIVSVISSLVFGERLKWNVVMRFEGELKMKDIIEKTIETASRK